MILVDTDILIQFSRRDEVAAGWLDDNAELTTLAISVVTEMELIFGSRDKSHLKELARFLLKFETVQIDRSISRRASNLVENYCLSHRLQVPDSLIAATALELNCGLATINRKDFRFIEGLQLIDYP